MLQHLNRSIMLRASPETKAQRSIPACYFYIVISSLSKTPHSPHLAVDIRLTAACRAGTPAARGHIFPVLCLFPQENDFFILSI